MNKEVSIRPVLEHLSLEAIQRVVVACPEHATNFTLRQLEILLFLGKEQEHPDNRTVRAVAAGCNITKPVVTRAADTLGRIGLIERVRDMNDRRSVFLNLTSKGKRFLARI